jgi:hypothetical protein
MSAQSSPRTWVKVRNRVEQAGPAASAQGELRSGEKSEPSSGLRFAEHKADTLDRPIPSGRVTDTGPAGYPRGCGAVGTNGHADAGRFDRSGRHQQTCRRRSHRPHAVGTNETDRRRSLRAQRSAPINTAKRSLPCRAWRFGPTATLSGRGDNALPAPVTRIPKYG